MRRRYAVVCAFVSLAVAATLWGQEERPRTHAEIHVQNGEMLHFLQERVKTHSELLLSAGDAIEEIDGRIDASAELIESLHTLAHLNKELILELDKRTKTLAAAIQTILEREQQTLEPPRLKRQPR